MRPILPARAPGAGQAAHLRVVQGQTVKCSSFLTMFTLSTRFAALQGAEGTRASEWRNARCLLGCGARLDVGVSEKGRSHEVSAHRRGSGIDPRRTDHLHARMRGAYIAVARDADEHTDTTVSTTATLTVRHRYRVRNGD